MFKKLYSFLNKLLRLSFENQDDENRFQKEYIKDNLKQNKISFFIGFISYLGYLPIAYFFTYEDFYTALKLIIVLPLSFSIFFILAIDKDWFKKYIFLNLSIYALSISLPPIIMLLFTQKYYHIYFSNEILPIVALFIMYGAPFTLALMTVFLLFIIIVGVFSFTEINMMQAIYFYYFLSTAFFLAAISGYLMEKSKRRNYLAKYIQEDLNIELLKQQKHVKSLNETLQHRVDEEVAKNREKDQQLITQSRLAQMGEMISMIAHQWRQPLNAISATSNNLQLKLMMDDVDHTEFQQEIGLIDKYSQHLSKTIDDFRGFFKENKEKEVTTLDELVNSTLSIVKTSIDNKNIKIITNLKCNDEFETYPSEIKQVILNIIKNAEDILVENEIENPTITIETLCENQMNKQLIIKDNAGGVIEDIIDKIFDPYFSTKKEREGTGLGLYMSKTIIQDHCAGKLMVENDDNGAVFKIILNS